MKNLVEILLEKLHLNNDTEMKKDIDDPTTWSEGDILVRSGGYNMILVDFYKITKAMGKSFRVRELKKKNVSGNGWQGECVPIEDEFDPHSKELMCRITKYNSLKIDDGYAHLWDGKPCHYDHLD